MSKVMDKFKGLIKSKVTKNAGWLIGGNIIHKIIAFLVGIWMARYLGPSNMGLVDYAGVYLTFFFSVATLGINSVMVKKFIENPDREGTVLGTALVLQGGASIMSVLLIFCIVFLVDFGEPITIIVVFLSSLGLFFQVLDSVKYWFQSKLQSKYASIATIIAYIISSAYKIILLITEKSVIWFAVATSIDYLCVAVILFIVYKKKNGPPLRFSKDVAKELLKVSTPYILSGLMVSVYGATDKLMLKQMINEEAVGYYGRAVSIANVWVFILSAIIESTSPIIMAYRRDGDEINYRRKNLQLYRIIFYVSLAVSALMTVFAEFGIIFLYGEAFRGSVAPLRIITWYVAFSYLGVARDVWVVCENKQRYLPGIYLGSAVVNVALNAALIPFMGPSGAALASLICQISTIFVMPLFTKGMRPNVKLMLDAVFFRKAKEKEKLK